MYNPYNPYVYPVMQQRLQSMEQQYPQMTPTNYPQPQYNQQFLKGRAVTSIDEAKAAMIDLDGSVFIFPDISNKSIYTKQINLDGTASINTYRLVQDVPVTSTDTKQTETQDVAIIANDISSIKDMLISVQNQIKDLQSAKPYTDKTWRGAKSNEPVSNDTTITK